MILGRCCRLTLHVQSLRSVSIADLVDGVNQPETVCELRINTTGDGVRMEHHVGDRYLGP